MSNMLIPNLGLDRQIGQVHYGHLGVFSAKLSVPVLVQCVHLFGIEIWIRDLALLCPQSVCASNTQLYWSPLLIYIFKLCLALHLLFWIPTVNGVLDLNAMPGCKDPGENRNHKTLCCLCCASGPISAVIHTNRTGYVPGKWTLSY